MDNKDLYDESILLIGPSGAGKSTVAQELAAMNDLPLLRLDGIANKARRTGFIKKFSSSEEYNEFMLRTLLQKALIAGVPGIVDFGAGHSVYDNPERFKRIKELLSKFKNVVLLLPTPDIESSLEIMAKRSTGDYSTNEKFIKSPCNRELATMVVYQNGRTPKEVAENIMQLIETRNMNQAYERSEE